ncbi:unnamed protein product [Pedinophyceae sp. YPF-701]|nr:unnamed protein product [Pedinophyceae sp. YPF-701]
MSSPPDGEAPPSAQDIDQNDESAEDDQSGSGLAESLHTNHAHSGSAGRRRPGESRGKKSSSSSLELRAGPVTRERALELLERLGVKGELATCRASLAPASSQANYMGKYKIASRGRESSRTAHYIFCHCSECRCAEGCLLEPASGKKGRVFAAGSFKLHETGTRSRSSPGRDVLLWVDEDNEWRSIEELKGREARVPSYLIGATEAIGALEGSKGIVTRRTARKQRGEDSVEVTASQLLSGSGGSEPPSRKRARTGAGAGTGNGSGSGNTPAASGRTNGASTVHGARGTANAQGPAQAGEVGDEGAEAMAIDTLQALLGGGGGGGGGASTSPDEGSSMGKAAAGGAAAAAAAAAIAPGGGVASDLEAYMGSLHRSVAEEGHQLSKIRDRKAQVDREIQRVQRQMEDLGRKMQSLDTERGALDVDIQERMVKQEQLRLWLSGIYSSVQAAQQHGGDAGQRTAAAQAV